MSHVNFNHTAEDIVIQSNWTRQKLTHFYQDADFEAWAVIHYVLCRKIKK